MLFSISMILISFIRPRLNQGMKLFIWEEMRLFQKVLIHFSKGIDLIIKENETNEKYELDR